MEEHVNKAMGHDPKSVSSVGVGEKKVRFRIAMVGFVLFIIFVIGVLWFLTNPEMGVGLSLSFIAGLTMIFLPCTLPMAFVIVPMTLGKAPMKGFLMALFFGSGLAITLSFYGVFIAYIGQFLGLTAATQIMLVIGGSASLLFGLSEIRLLKFRLPSYTGKFPDFIQKQGDYVKVFLLGLFLGNAGVGCPNPAFYVLMGYIATVGDLFNGWILGLVHGIGRAVPLIFLAILGILGVNATGKLTGKQESIEKYMGWVLIYIGAFILTFGVFGHDWFVSSGFHTSWEKVVVAVAGEQFGENVLQHVHKLVNIEGFINYGNMFFLALVGIIIALFAKFKKPGKKFLRGLLAIYFVLILLIGYMTAWTFMLSPDAVHGGDTTSSLDSAAGDHSDPPGTPSDHGHDENGGTESAVSPVETMTFEEVGVGFVESSGITEGLSVDLTLSSADVTAGEEVELSFFVNMKPDGSPVVDLEIEHEKYMHVIGVRDDLSEFFHIHPSDNEDGVWSVDYVFEKPGTYKIWSDVKYNGATQTFGHDSVIVSGDDVFDETKENTYKFSNSITVDRYQLELDSHEGVEALRKSEIDIVISDVFGDSIELDQYLGADMHVAIIKDDLSVFIHAHPSEHDAAGDEHVHGNTSDGDSTDHGTKSLTEKELSFVSTFPLGGVYKMFAQFRPTKSEFESDEALVGEFYINVESEIASALSEVESEEIDEHEEENTLADDGHTDHSHDSGAKGPWYQDTQWWTFFLVSIVLIFLLSFWVKRYLKVE